MTSVGRSARRRVHGLDRVSAGRPEAGDMLGRLLLSGEITEAQHAAGRAYAGVRTDYDKAMGARRVRSAADVGDGGPSGPARDADDPEHVAWVARRRKAYEAARRALTSCHDPLAAMVLDGIVLEERTMWNHVGTLRLALNAVGRALGTFATPSGD